MAAETKDVEDEKQLRDEWMLLNSPLTPPGQIGNIWEHILSQENTSLNARQPFWNYDAATVDYFKNRLSDSLPPITAGRICFYLWTATREIDYAVKAIEYFFKAFEMHAFSTEFDHGNTCQLCCRFAFRLLLSLNYFEPLQKTYLPRAFAIFDSLSDKKEFGSRHFELAKILLPAYVTVWSSLSDPEKANAQKIIEYYWSKANVLCKQGTFHFAVDIMSMIELFAKATKDNNLLSRAQTFHLNAIITEGDQFPAAMLKADWYKSAVSYMQANNITDKILLADLMKKIEKFSSESLKDFKVVSVESTMPTAAFDAAAESVCQDSLGIDRLERLAQFVLPPLEEIKKLASAKDGTLMSILPITIQRDGYISKAITDPEERAKLELVHATINSLQFSSSLIRHALEKYAIPLSDFLSAIQSAEVTEGSKTILTHGLGEHFEADYISSCHVLVPQIESLIRQEAKRRGKTSIVYDTKNRAIVLQTLSYLAGNEEVTEIYGEPFCNVLRAYYTDMNGNNLRNEIAHGFVDIETLNRSNSIITVFLLVYMLSVTKISV